MATDLKLGDLVRATNPLRRHRNYTTRRNEWITPSWSTKTPTEGMVVGLRTYWDGVCSGGFNMEDPVSFKGDKALKVALICSNVRHKPVAFLVENCAACSRR